MIDHNDTWHRSIFLALSMRSDLLKKIGLLNAIPDYQSLMRPLLAFASNGSEKNINDAVKGIANQLPDRGLPSPMNSVPALDSTSDVR
jgi:hypothetical protein